MVLIEGSPDAGTAAVFERIVGHDLRVRYLGGPDCLNHLVAR